MGINMRSSISRRVFLGQASLAATTTVAWGGSSPTRSPLFRLGFHTGAFNASNWSFAQCLDWAVNNDLHYIECGVVDGVTWNHGLGYFPHIALWEDPALLRKKMERRKIEFSQIDAAFPLSRPEGASLGVEYVLHAIRWAKLAGCPRVDTTDDRKRPEGMTDREGLDHLRRIYRQILPVAEAHKIIVNIEPHGYFTTNPDFLAEMLAFVDSPFLRVNMDTGNVFIAGQDPVKFVERFKDKIDHVHIKDVSPNLATTARGKQTGIATSHCAVGEGINADNIRKCVGILAANGYGGVLSIECEAEGGPMIERSLAWLRELVKAALPQSAQKPN
jgi:inosose dehydratase